MTRQIFLILSVMALILVWILFIGFWLASRKNNLNVLEAAYLEFCALLQEDGFERKKGETPAEFCDRISLLKPEWAEALKMITDIFYQEYYASSAAAVSLKSVRMKGKKTVNTTNSKKAARAIVRLAKSLV